MNKDDEFNPNVFVQGYHNSNNKKFMEGTKDFPFRFVGELVSYEDGKLVVRQLEDDTMCCAPVMHHVFSKSRISLSLNGTEPMYLTNLDFTKTKSVITGSYLYTTFVLHNNVGV